MPHLPPPRPKKPRKSAVAQTSLPSLFIWENAWERPVDLDALRRRKRDLENLRWLAEYEHRIGEDNDKDPQRGDPPRIDGSDIKTLVNEQGLELAKAGRLLEDARLIAEWFFELELLEHIGLGQANKLKELKAASVLAKKLAWSLDLAALDFEHMISSLPPRGGDEGENDLLELKRRAERFAVDAERAHGEIVKSGRNSEERRNGALALIAWAAEEAFADKIEVSRRAKDGRYFTNRPGQFAFNFMTLLGFKNEQALERVFEDMRRQPRVDL